MKKITRIIVFFLFIMVCGFYFTISKLIVDEQPLQSDVIIVVEGSFERSHRATELLKMGYSKSSKLIVTPYTQIERDLYKRLEVENNAIIPEHTATSTYKNAVNSLKIMNENKFKSAIIVSSDYHMRRTKLIFDRENQKYNFKLNYVAAYNPDDNHNYILPWFKTDYSQFKYAGFEVFKYWAYYLGLYKYLDL